MLWRQAYQPRVLEGLEASELADGLYLGVFDARGQSELGIWLRLFESAGLDSRASILAVSIRDTRKFLAVLPPSRHSQIVFTDLAESLRGSIAPDRPERAFAAIVRDGIAGLLVVGAPTEEVWERFEARASLLRGLE